jgi:hypothetical protein
LYQIKVGISKNKVGITNIKVGFTRNKVGIIIIIDYILKPPPKRGHGTQTLPYFMELSLQSAKTVLSKLFLNRYRFSQSDGQMIFEILLPPKLRVGICCLSDKHTALRRKSKDRLNRNRDNVS